METNEGKNECEDQAKCITNGELTLCGCFMVKQDEMTDKQDEIESLKAKLSSEQDKFEGALSKLRGKNEEIEGLKEKNQIIDEGLAGAMEDLGIEQCKNEALKEKLARAVERVKKIDLGPAGNPSVVIDLLDILKVRSNEIQEGKKSVEG